MSLYGRFSGCRSVKIALAEPSSSEIRASLTFTTVETYFFVPEPLWNSDKQKLSNFRIDFFYRSVISPFANKLFLLLFSSHCSTQNIGFSDSGYFIKPPQPSSAVTELRLSQGTLKKLVFLCWLRVDEMQTNSVLVLPQIKSRQNWPATLST